MQGTVFPKCKLCQRRLNFLCISSFASCVRWHGVRDVCISSAMFEMSRHRLGLHMISYVRGVTVYEVLACHCEPKQDCQICFTFRTGGHYAPNTVPKKGCPISLIHLGARHPPFRSANMEHHTIACGFHKRLLFDVIGVLDVLGVAVFLQCRGCHRCHRCLRCFNYDTVAGLHTDYGTGNVDYCSGPVRK